MEEEKKCLKISLRATICVVIVFILIIAWVCLRDHKNNSDSTNMSAKAENTLSSSEAISTNTTNTTATTNNTNTNPTATATTGTEINVDDVVVKELVEKVNFPIYATASIYKVGEFDLNTISNDLILRLGWSKIDNDSKKLIEGNQENKQTATKEVLNNSITNIFGSNVKYTDESFTNIDVTTFDGYSENKGEISYSNNLYTANYIEGGGGDAPFIHQEIKKVQKYDDKIEIYVNTAFIDTQYNESTDDFKYTIYKDFNDGKFEEKISETSSTEFAKNYSNDEYDGKIALTSNSEISKIASKLNTYVYTFELDNATGEYYLSGFNISK